MFPLRKSSAKSSATSLMSLTGMEQCIPPSRSSPNPQTSITKPLPPTPERRRPSSSVYSLYRDYSCDTPYTEDALHVSDESYMAEFHLQPLEQSRSQPQFLQAKTEKPGQMLEAKTYSPNNIIREYQKSPTASSPPESESEASEESSDIEIMRFLEPGAYPIAEGSAFKDFAVTEKEELMQGTPNVHPHRRQPVNEGSWAAHHATNTYEEQYAMPTLQDLAPSPTPMDSPLFFPGEESIEVPLMSHEFAANSKRSSGHSQGHVRETSQEKALLSMGMDSKTMSAESRKQKAGLTGKLMEYLPASPTKAHPTRSQPQSPSQTSAQPQSDLFASHDPSIASVGDSRTPDRRNSSYNADSEPEPDIEPITFARDYHAVLAQQHQEEKADLPKRPSVSSDATLDDSTTSAFMRLVPPPLFFHKSSAAAKFKLKPSPPSPTKSTSNRQPGPYNPSQAIGLLTHKPSPFKTRNTPPKEPAGAGMNTLLQTSPTARRSPYTSLFGVPSQVDVYHAATESRDERKRNTRLSDLWRRSGIDPAIARDESRRTSIVDNSLQRYHQQAQTRAPTQSQEQARDKVQDTYHWRRRRSSALDLEKVATSTSMPRRLPSIIRRPSEAFRKSDPERKREKERDSIRNSISSPLEATARSASLDMVGFEVVGLPRRAPAPPVPPTAPSAVTTSPASRKYTQPRAPPPLTPAHSDTPCPSQSTATPSFLARTTRHIRNKKSGDAGARSKSQERRDELKAKIRLVKGDELNAEIVAERMGAIKLGVLSGAGGV